MSIRRYTYVVLSIVLFLSWSSIVSAYAEASYYSQSYYQSYYQTYYQAGYYTQSSYGVTFTTPVTALGNVSVIGALAKGGGSFVIDHPQDPQNKLLYHSFVESPDVKNLYDGVVTLNARGEALVELPDYFEALNKDYRYQVKALTAPMPDLHIQKEIAGGYFIIGGGAPGEEVSWQVTGTRRDPYILANPVVVEVEKGPDADIGRGAFVFSEGYTNLLPLQGFLTGVWGSVRGILGR
jgi:hypothetical protein